MIPPLDEIEIERIHKGSAEEKKAERKTVNVDMNPMVDLAFLLLTFFMLATTFSKPQAMELLVPAKPNTEDVEKEMPVKESKTMSIVLTSEQIIWYKGISDPETNLVAYGSPQLEVILRTANAQIDGLVVLIKPSNKSNYSHLVEVLDALNYADVKRYALSGLSDFDKSLEVEPASTKKDE